MSNLGLQILYSEINVHEDYAAERCYAPKADLAEKMRSNGIPLLSLESGTPLKEFDVVGFSLQFELLYTNILYMLDLAGIPFYSRDRGEDFPLIIAGGPCAVNPEPFADFFDCVVVGEGEGVDFALLRLVEEGKSKGGAKGAFWKKQKRLGACMFLLFTRREKTWSRPWLPISRTPCIPSILSCPTSRRCTNA